MAIVEDSFEDYRLVPKLSLPVPYETWVFDPVLQDAWGNSQAPSLLENFEGLGKGFIGPNGSFRVGAAPPDANGDVGPNHYVQMVNSSIAVFDKQGTPVFGPVRTNSI